jgi:hypothetical protein
MATDAAWKRTFRIKNFTGEDEDEWRVWSSKMLALAQRKGYHGMLTTVVNLTAEADIEKNKEAISDLTIACDGEAWEIMHNLDITGEPTAYQMWQALREQFEPHGIDDYVDLTTRFKECVMEDEEQNPKKWIRKLQAINRRLGDVSPDHRHDDVQMIAEVFMKLPPIYSEFITSCNLRGVANNGNMQEIIKDLERFYKRRIKNGEQNSKNPKDKEKAAFLAEGKQNAKNKDFVDFAKAFKGMCNKCGRQGHKGVDCRVRPENYVKGNRGDNKNYFKTNNGYRKPHIQNSDKSNKNCFICNEKGHFARDCNQRKDNANRTMFVGNLDYYEVPEGETIQSIYDARQREQWLDHWFDKLAETNKCQEEETDDWKECPNSGYPTSSRRN